MDKSNGREDVLALMRQALGESYCDLAVNRVVIEEDLRHGATSISAEVFDAATGTTSVIAAKGVGLIDAFFRGMVQRFAKEYPSLNTIKFSSFSVKAKLDTKRGFSGADSEAEVTVEITNSEDKQFLFAHHSPSLISASIVTTLRGLEYFINSERAFVSMYNAYKDAKERNRSDLVQRYTSGMAILVQNTSYSEVIDKMRTDAEM
jgi:hypothetical protein